ncbi:hypothetical protein HTV80_12885 [Streptomyces sp. Vc74B-19]|uniref:hypothetical protein n=1 Tax=Streptomyces TaxID=1883 RepID=UPI001BFC5766|nr:hypothetical protein [Streptomyces sp. Vc74B-19]MBT3164005.1 hypothetical protein [Streptomyces sp. Vc74B-19]
MTTTTDPAGEPTGLTLAPEPEPGELEPIEPEPAEPEPVEPEPDEPEPGERPHRQRAVALPDLRPYADPRAAAGLAAAGLKASRRPARSLARRTAGALLALTRSLLTGSARLVSLILGWISGAHGPGGSVAARLGGAVLAGGATAHTLADHPGPAGAALTAAWALAALLADHGKLDPRPKKTSSKGKPSTDTKPGTAVEKAPEHPRKGLAAWFRKAPAPTPENTGKKAPEKPRPEPSHDDLVRALHGLVGAGRGVLLTALRQRLQLADTKAVRALLAQHSIPTRPGVRAEGGNGPGVHRDDFPPLPPSPDTPVGEDIVRGQRTNNNEPTPAPWSAKELQQGFRIVPDPDHGPSASRVEYLHKKR